MLYWRPIVPGWNDQPETMGHVLMVGKDADAIVFTGYYHKPKNAAYLRGLGVQVPYEQEYSRRKVLPADLDARAIPTGDQFEAVLDGLGYSSDYLIEDGHMWTHGRDEQRRYAIQHALGFQIWELDQPHPLHVHGRSLTGYQPTEQEYQQLAAVREQFTRATRLDEDG